MYGASALTSRPSRRTVPAGRVAAGRVMTLNSVVLPGAVRADEAGDEPGVRSRSTSSSARLPPKRTVSPRHFERAPWQLTSLEAEPRGRARPTSSGVHGRSMPTHSSGTSATRRRPRLRSPASGWARNPATSVKPMSSDHATDRRTTTRRCRRRARSRTARRATRGTARTDLALRERSKPSRMSATAPFGLRPSPMPMNPGVTVVMFGEPGIDREQRPGRDRGERREADAGEQRPPTAPMPPTTASMKICRPPTNSKFCEIVLSCKPPNSAPPSPAMPAEIANTASLVPSRFMPSVAHAAWLSFIASSRRPNAAAPEPARRGSRRARTRSASSMSCRYSVSNA